jgi:NAD(P)-dependent dehydrogenase (short-subunit alcohol dehydrogenase family)
VGTCVDTISKAAIRKLGEVMAHELAGHGIRVNTVEPGHISTHFERLAYDEETLAKAATNVPQGRLGTPEDIGKVVAFFCSEDASYVTGQTITVDGGLRLA